MPNKPPVSCNNQILMVGNFLYEKGWSKSQSELLAEILEARGYHIIRVSSQANRILRLVDMLWQIWFSRNNYCLAQIAVFSGSAFLWAEATSYLLKALRKPFILTLHGGG